MSGQPEALRLADEYEYVGFIEKHRFAKEEWCRKAALELRRLHAENEALRSGYDASRLEIESLRARVQELGEMLRENRSKRIVALEAENLGLLHALAAEQDANADLRQQLDAIGAGGVEPLRRRDHFRGAAVTIFAAPRKWCQRSGKHDRIPTSGGSLERPGRRAQPVGQSWRRRKNRVGAEVRRSISWRHEDDLGRSYQARR